MANDEKPGRFNQAAQDLKNYGGLYFEGIKLGLIENLSSFSNTLFGVLLLFVLFGMALMFFAVALTWVIGMLIGSMLGAFAIMGCLFVVSGLIVLMFRKRLAVNSFVRIFSRMIDDLNKKYSDDE